MHKQQNTRQSLWKKTGDNEKFCHVASYKHKNARNISTLFPPASLLKVISNTGSVVVWWRWSRMMHGLLLIGCLDLHLATSSGLGKL